MRIWIAARRLVAVPAALLLVSVAVHAAAPATKPADMDNLLAPIALYPDQLLAPMLVSAANPGRIGALAEWLRSHEGTAGSELQEAAAQAGFEESYVALALFPDVVEWMAGRAQWTSQVGKAFAEDRAAVFDSIQRLRAKAQKAGSLKSTPQQTVETRKTSGGEQVIVIEPANPQVVYVPQYNPQVVYTQPASSTVVVQQQSSSSSDAAVAGLIGFTAGIAIGAAIDNDHYYGPYGWHGGAYMYNDAWDDWYDAREDAREDWQDHREDMYEDRSDRAKDTQQQRTERQQTAQQQRTDRQQTSTQQRAERQQTATTQQRTDRQQAQGRSTTAASPEARGYSGNGRAAGERSGTKSDAFSGYSSGRSERAASSRGERSRSSSRSGSRSGGGRRR